LLPNNLIYFRSSAQDDKHLGPVWQIVWIIEEDTTRDDSITESMLTLGDDGLLKRWSLTKGFESSSVLINTPYSIKQLLLL